MDEYFLHLLMGWIKYSCIILLLATKLWTRDAMGGAKRPVLRFMLQYGMPASSVSAIRGSAYVRKGRFPPKCDPDHDVIVSLPRIFSRAIIKTKWPEKQCPMTFTSFLFITNCAHGMMISDPLFICQPEQTTKKRTYSSHCSAFRLLLKQTSTASQNLFCLGGLQRHHKKGTPHRAPCRRRPTTHQPLLLYY